MRHVAAAAMRRAGAGAAVAEAVTGPAASRPSSPRPPERIVANAIGRAGERVHGLPLFFDRVECADAGLAELAELFPDQPLISVVEGPAEALGVVAICPGLLTSLIEMQALGRISSRPVPARRPTRADGAICADFINACLAELGGELALVPGWEGLRGYRYASFLDDSRPLGLMLDDVTFHRLTIRLRAGVAGQRDGCIVVALPVAAAAASARTSPADALMPPQPPRNGEAGGGSLAEVVRSVPIDLVGVLCRRMISLGELRALAPGDTITLPPGVLGAATLETAAGQILLRGKLGELAGRHALRLTDGADAASLPLGGGQGEGRRTAASHEPPIADLGAPDLFRNPRPPSLLPGREGDGPPGVQAAADPDPRHADEGDTPASPDRRVEVA